MCDRPALSSLILCAQLCAIQQAPTCTSRMPQGSSNQLLTITNALCSIPETFQHTFHSTVPYPRDTGTSKAARPVLLVM